MKIAIINGRLGLRAVPNPGQITGTKALIHSAMVIPLAPCVPTIDSKVLSLAIQPFPMGR